MRGQSFADQSRNSLALKEGDTVKIGRLFWLSVICNLQVPLTEAPVTTVVGAMIETPHHDAIVAPPGLLITDDDRDFRETLREVFEPRGFRTWLAGDGDEALDILGSEPVHLLVVDMHMPRLSGLETIRRARENQVTIPWILMSAALDDEIIREAQEAEAFSVLPKPVGFAQLTAVVQQAMRLTYHWPD